MINYLWMKKNPLENKRNGKKTNKNVPKFATAVTCMLE